MDRFRKLATVALLSGTLVGLFLFVVQHFTIFPLIQKAEVYESAADKQMPGMHHDDEGWHPADGTQRTSFTVLSTVLTAIGFAALLFGTAAIPCDKVVIGRPRLDVVTPLAADDGIVVLALLLLSVGA